MWKFDSGVHFSENYFDTIRANRVEQAEDLRMRPKVESRLVFSEFLCLSIYAINNHARPAKVIHPVLVWKQPRL